MRGDTVSPAGLTSPAPGGGAARPSSCSAPTRFPPLPHAVRGPGAGSPGGARTPAALASRVPSASARGGVSLPSLRVCDGAVGTSVRHPGAADGSGQDRRAHRGGSSAARSTEQLSAPVRLPAFLSPVPCPGTAGLPPPCSDFLWGTSFLPPRLQMAPSLPFSFRRVVRSVQTCTWCVCAALLSCECPRCSFRCPWK